MFLLLFLFVLQATAAECEVIMKAGMSNTEMHYYSTEYKKGGNIITTYGNMLSYVDFVKVRFERPNENGRIDYADGRIPSFTIEKSEGFSKEELGGLIEYMKNNAAFIWSFAEKGGVDNA